MSSQFASEISMASPGIGAPPQMQGRALQDPASGHDLIFAEAEGGRRVMVRSDRSKLILTNSPMSPLTI